MIFTTVLCVVFSMLVSVVAVALHDRQVENRRLDRIKKVLGVAGLAEPGESLTPDELNRRFEAGLERGGDEPPRGRLGHAKDHCQQTRREKQRFPCVQDGNSDGHQHQPSDDRLRQKAHHVVAWIRILVWSRKSKS